MKRVISRCECGKRKSQYADKCNACHKARMDACYSEAEQIVAKGKCPKCGASMRRNTSMEGWWQCGQYGADGWRADNSKPTCSFQIFTRPRD